MPRLKALIASVGSDCHFERTGIRLQFYPERVARRPCRRTLVTNSVSPLDAYLTHLTVERRLAANSIESYARDLNGLAEFAAGRGQSVERLTRQDLEALVRDQMSRAKSIAVALVVLAVLVSFCDTSLRAAMFEPDLVAADYNGGVVKAFDLATATTHNNLSSPPFTSAAVTRAWGIATDIGNRQAGAITAGMFLKSFAGSVPWAHLDIAGTAWLEQAKPYMAKGATGFGVRVMASYIIKKSSESSESGESGESGAVRECV